MNPFMNIFFGIKTKTRTRPLVTMTPHGRNHGPPARRPAAADEGAVHRPVELSRRSWPSPQMARAAWCYGRTGRSTLWGRSQRYYTRSCLGGTGLCPIALRWARCELRLDTQDCVRLVPNLILPFFSAGEDTTSILLITPTSSTGHPPWDTF